MINKNSNFFDIFADKIFILIDIIGALIFIGSVLLENSIIASFGITILTLGITLPIALYFQIKQSGESFEIIKSCNIAGIKNIIVNRKDAEGDKKLRNAIDEIILKTKNIDLLGIAFPEILKHDIAIDSPIKQQLRNPDVNVRILLLKPDSTAAQRRGIIEDPEQQPTQGITIHNIGETINFLNIFIRSRLEAKFIKESKDWKAEVHKIAEENLKNKEKFFKVIRSITNINVKLYAIDPIVYIISTDDFMFSEQYHFGRPGFIKYTATCIGEYMPLLQFEKNSKGYQCLKSHYDYVWNTHEISEDITDNLISQAIQKSIANFNWNENNTN